MTSKKFYIGGLLVSLLLAGFVSFYASSHPDGLEKVASEIGFIDSAKDPATAGSALADYGVEGVENERASVGIAGVIGVAATGVLATGLFLYLGKRKKS
ncbi:MAG: PDGLE domain-containing protein [Candidatus Planktophila sp.]|nr:PDGLE domain-containing protein [Candidatus Planktophila sp.]